MCSVSMTHFIFIRQALISEHILKKNKLSWALLFWIQWISQLYLNLKISQIQGHLAFFFSLYIHVLRIVFCRLCKNKTSLEKYYVYIICFRCPDENYAQSSITLYRYPRSMSAQNTHSGVGTIILIFNNKSMISVYWVKYKTRWTISMNDVERC